MSELQHALSSLQPREWSEIPIDDLSLFLRDSFAQAELLLNSVPPPPGGSDFLSSTRTITSSNKACKASEIIHSEARPPPPSPDHGQFQKAWGKPLRINAKDNPLGITMYKMAGHDRHGAWFGRRSVHEGLGFTKWKKAMQREFPESLSVKGGPGEGSVRGIGADRRLEREVVEGVGKLEVYQLSAQFPGPVAPREFITCLLTTEDGLSDHSAPHIDSSKESKQIPRHYMVVSIPVDHPDAPPRQGLVRGHYESVEIIREIPLPPSKSQSTPDLLNMENEKARGRQRGSTIGFAESRGDSAKGERMDTHDHAEDDPEANPVEWIMITRSDPGGGIPRFMVERNTPASITADAFKFLDWATGLDETTPEEEEEDSGKQEEAQKHAEQHHSVGYNVAESNGHLAGVMPAGDPSLTGAFEPSGPGDTGIIASLTSAVQSGMDNYAPNVVKDNLPSFLQQQEEEEGSGSSDTDSFNSFTSATADFKTAYEGPRSPDPLDSTSSLSLMPDDSSGFAETGSSRKTDQKHYEKELAKLEAKKKSLDEKMSKNRLRDSEKREELAQKEEKDSEKQKEKLEKDKKKREERYTKEMKKLEERKAKEDRRLEQKNRKARDKDALGRVQRERDEYRRQLELVRRENELLRRQMGELQRENTLLVQKVGKTEVGQSALKQVKEELAGSERKRASSVGSRASVKSKRSVGSKESPNASKLSHELGAG